MNASVVESIIGHSIRLLRSDFIISEITTNDEISFRMAYQSQIHLEINSKPVYQIINISSKWYEDEDGSDHLEMDFDLDKKYALSDIDLHMPYPSTISIWERFLVTKVETFGYNIDFNLKSQTNHIALFYAEDGRKMLIRPEITALGLCVTMNQNLIDFFFSSAPNNEFIYRSNIYQ